MRRLAAESIDEYIAQYPPAVQRRLQALRRTIRATAPDPKETISYSIPTIIFGEQRVYFAGFANHVGFYPGAAVMAVFKKELSGFTWGKGSVQFPHARPLPLAFVRKVIRFRLRQARRRSRA